MAISRKPAHSQHDEHDEHTPLLADPESAPSTDHEQQQQKESRGSIISRPLIQCILIMMLVEFAAPFVDTPSTRVQEEIICRSFHPDIANGDDPRCKGDDVQGELAFINGWFLTFTLIPGLVLSVPYGLLADKVGRKFVLNLSILGTVLSVAALVLIYRLSHLLPVRMVWASCLFNIIGGGPTVFVATVFTIMGDSVQDEHRTIVFSYAGSAMMGALFAAGPLVYLIMEWSDWLSIYIGLGLFSLSLVLGLTLPYQPVAQASHAHKDNADDMGMVSRVAAGMRTFLSSIRAQLAGNRNLLLLFCSILFTSLGKSFTFILSQYCTRRYGWSWSEAGLLSNLKTIIVMLVTSVVVPALDTLLRVKYGWTLFKKDMWMARICIVVMIIGFLGTSVAPNTPTVLIAISFYSLAAGYEFILRSLLVQAAHSENIATVYTTMSVLETTGLLISGPTLAATFKLGLRWGGSWIGLPFVVAAVLVGTGGLLLYALKEEEQVDAEDE